MRKLLRLLGGGLRNGFVAIGALAFLGTAIAVADYAVTQGSGTSFASKVIGGTVHYAAQLICDATAGEAQCQAVDSHGQAQIDVAANASTNNLYAAITAPVPCLNATAFNTNSYSTGQTNPANCDLHGNLYVNVSPGAPATPIVAAASDNHAVIKNGVGIAYSATTSNNSSTKNYLRLYDAGTGFNGCNSATGVIFAMEIPPNDSGFTVSLGGGHGITFANGLSICITSGFGLTDTTNATASAIYANITTN